MTRPWLRPDSNGVYVAEHSALEEQIKEKMSPPVRPVKPAPSYGWVSGGICFFVSAAMGAQFFEAVFLGLAAAYCQYAIVTVMWRSK